MKKKIRPLLCCALITTALTAGFPASHVLATPTDTQADAAVNQEDGTPENTPTQPALPECYNWPIQSNETEGWPQGPQVQAETAIVMEADSGCILYAKGIDEKREPASITKIMTALVALEHSRMDEQVTFSHNAVFSIEQGSTHIGIKEGEVLTMEQCLYGVLLASANEVSNGVAEHVGGSIEGFVEMMNEKAREIGCKNTHFSNANGLHNEEHYTTAYDMALITQAALKNPTFRSIMSTDHFIIPTTNITDEERWLNNHHKMLRETKFHYEGCIGGKTGYTTDAGNTLVTVADRNDMELICVTLKTNANAVYTDTALLLDYGFNNFQKIALCQKKQQISVRLLPFDRQFYSEHASGTIGEYQNDAYAVIPSDIQIANLAKQVSIKKNLEETEYYFNSKLITRRLLSLSSVLTSQSPENAVNLLTNTLTDHTDGNIITKFKALPSWKYPVLGILGFILIFYIILLILRIKRRKKRRRKRKK